MISGYNEWNQFITKGMEFRELGGKKVFTFSEMKNNFYEILLENANRTPDKILFVDNKQRNYSYKQFVEMVDYMAASLKKIGVKRQSHVGLLLHTSIEFCVGFYAVCKLAAVAVPFPSKYREPEIKHLIEKADLDILLCSDEFKPWMCELEADGLCCIYSVDEENRYGFEDFATERGYPVKCDAVLTDEVIMMFTSGTTSESKGVILKNYNIIHAVMIYKRTLGITYEDKTVIPVPIYHITGLIALLGLFVYAGGTVYLYKRYDAKELLRCITQHNITFMHGSPTVFGILLDYRNEYPNLPSIRSLACGSSYMPINKINQMHQWMPNMKLQIVYGMTETSSPAMVFPYDTATSIYKGSVGKVIPGLELMIKNDDGKELERGDTGVIWIRGANILEYYYKMDSGLIDKNGWLDTGDVGYVNEDGYVYIVDRKKDIINRGGEKIWSTDVEEEIICIDGVKDAAVVGIPDEKYGEVAAAVVVLEEGVLMTEEDIKEKLRSKLARYKLPEQIKFVDDVPKTAGLKTNKKLIKTLF